jgi:hypothetical protein
MARRNNELDKILSSRIGKDLVAILKEKTYKLIVAAKEKVVVRTIHHPYIWW